MEEYQFKYQYRPQKRHGMTFGIILIVLGALFLLFNFGILDGGWKRVIFSWQMLLIICGVFSFVYRHFLHGFILSAVGLFFIIPKLIAVYPETFDWLGNDFTKTYWPVLLIFAGILFIVKLFNPKWVEIKGHTCNNKHYRSKRRKNGCGFERNSVFGNVEEIVLDPVFTGGEVNSVFGNIILDLRKTTLPEGETEVELNAVFGGITLYVPDNWNVELHLDNICSGFEDKRNLSAETDYTHKLIVVGAFVFGGGEIRS
ncbi:MAG: cell wall-active antibiotics response protein [Prevotellaceae bacterium]|jgi:predicted membrane protein|nr:cell wall-active antibiotics response protein [Prevotellaceae bacterium]